MSKGNYKLLMRSLDIPHFRNIEELSNFTGLSETLLYCLSQKSERYYKKINIPKKSGGNREVFAPSFQMHVVQRWILRNILDKIRPSKQAMAFRRGKEYGCKSNAIFHIETHYGVAMDLKNFFPNIGANQVYNVFSYIGYDNLSATILTNLCTLNGFLPQGGSCSPALSNLVCLSLDARLNGLCKQRRIRFSRYADDMYFSCDNQNILKKAIPIIRKIIYDEGFTINEKKVHYYTPSNRKVITGITISKGIHETEPQLRANKNFKKKIRSEIFKAMMTGDYSAKAHILGEVAYVNYLEPKYTEKVKQYIDSTSKKILIFPELVNMYNDNKFYSDIKEISYTDLSSFQHIFSYDDIELEEYLVDVYESRQTYLKKIGMLDICKYEGWPLSTDDKTSYDDFPF